MPGSRRYNLAHIFYTIICFTGRFRYYILQLNLLLQVRLFLPPILRRRQILERTVDLPLPGHQGTGRGVFKLFRHYFKNNFAFNSKIFSSTWSQDSSEEI